MHRNKSRKWLLMPAIRRFSLILCSLTGKTDNVAIWFGALMNLNGAKQ